MPNGFGSFTLVFLTDVTSYQCLVPDVNLTEDWRKSIIPVKVVNGEPELSRCSRYRLDVVTNLLAQGLVPGRDVNLTDLEQEGCMDGWSYSKDIYQSTLVSEYDLVCSDEWKRPFTSTVFFLGVIVGSFFSGQLSDRGALASRMLLALICAAELQTQNQRSQVDCEPQDFLAEYLDAACSLLFELLLLGHEASKCSSADNSLSVGWMLGVLQPHPHLLSFIGHQVQQVVLVLSDLQESFLSPVQSVLLFQRCRLLLACLQYNNQLAQHLSSHFRVEFRYFVKLSRAEEKLPPHHPISQPTVRLVEQILAVYLHR